MLSKTPPHSKEIERAVLSAAMNDEQALEYLCENIKDEYYYDPQNALINSALNYCYVHYKAFDYLEAVEELKRRNDLDTIGGEVSLTGLWKEFPSGRFIKIHCDSVIEYYRKRQIIAMCSAVQAGAYDTAEKSKDVINNANALLDNITGDDDKRGFQTLQEMIFSVRDDIEAANRREGIDGIRTGFPTLDKYTNGWQPGETIIVGAPKKAGKSFLGALFASEAALKGHSVGIFTLEMTTKSLIKRLIANKSELDVTSVHHKKLTIKEIAKMVDACGKLYNYGTIVFDDNAGTSIQEMVVKSRRMKKLYDIEMLVVDYVQLMPSTGNESRQREVEKISHGLKGIAKNLNIPVILLSQLGRAQKGKEDHAPLMTDLKDSGALEADSSIVLLIHNPSDDRKRKLLEAREYGNNPSKELLFSVRELIVAANRSGKTSSIPMIFTGEHAHFGELAYKYDRQEDDNE